MTELLPCPFCGGEADVTKTNYETWISCEYYDCFTHQVSIHARTEAEAIAAWNTRTATTDADFARAVHDGHLWRRIDGHIRCEHCGLNIESVLALEGCNVNAIRFCPNCGNGVSA